MRLVAILFAIAAFVGFSYLACITATRTVDYVENRTSHVLKLALEASNDDWVTVDTDGLVVRLTGVAPDRAAKNRVMETMDVLISSSRIEDGLAIRPSEPPQPPEFFVDILRSNKRFSVIGLLPSGAAKQEIHSALDDVSGVSEITDMLDETEWDQPVGWTESVEFGTEIITTVNHGKVSIHPGEVTFSAMVENADVLERLEQQLRQDTPDNLILTLDLSAPRPVITPYQLRLAISERGARMPRCAAETPQGRQRILKAIEPLGLKADCAIGLGAPSPQWARAADLSVTALIELGAGSLEMTDADITLRGRSGTDEAFFTEIMDRLRGSLPPIFSLHVFLPKPVVEGSANDPTAPPRLVATRSEEGLVRISGAVLDEPARVAVRNFAEAQFGFGTVANDTFLREDLPEGWPARVFTSIEAFGLLRVGRLEVTERQISLRGTAYREAFLEDIRQILKDGLPAGVLVDADLDFDAEPEKPQVEILAEACAEQINDIMARSQITFPPSETDIAEESLPVIDDIATVLKACPASRFEIGGHTDSQGRETTNLAISQARADAVMAALMKRGLTQVFLTAQGYGESIPVADNETEQGRAENRRIEFNLVKEGEQPVEAASQSNEETAPETEVGSNDSGDISLPRACTEQINGILKSSQITFPPSETEIVEESLSVIDDIADVLNTCPASQFEIGGHTDSQGRESSNLTLSQDRADAVMAALLEREISQIVLTAKGYGESTPVADNKTEEGRAENRRIEFQLIEEDEAADTADPATEAVEADTGENSVPEASEEAEPESESEAETEDDTGTEAEAETEIEATVGADPDENDEAVADEETEAVINEDVDIEVGEEAEAGLDGGDAPEENSEDAPVVEDVPEEVDDQTEGGSDGEPLRPRSRELDQ